MKGVAQINSTNASFCPRGCYVFEEIETSSMGRIPATLLGQVAECWNGATLDVIFRTQVLAMDMMVWNILSAEAIAESGQRARV